MITGLNRDKLNTNYSDRNLWDKQRLNSIRNPNECRMQFNLMQIVIVVGVKCLHWKQLIQQLNDRICYGIWIATTEIGLKSVTRMGLCSENQWNVYVRTWKRFVSTEWYFRLYCQLLNPFAHIILWDFYGVQLWIDFFVDDSTNSMPEVCYTLQNNGDRMQFRAILYKIYYSISVSCFVSVWVWWFVFSF